MKYLSDSSHFSLSLQALDSGCGLNWYATLDWSGPDLVLKCPMCGLESIDPCPNHTCGLQSPDPRSKSHSGDCVNHITLYDVTGLLIPHRNAERVNTASAVPERFQKTVCLNWVCVCVCVCVYVCVWFARQVCVKVGLLWKQSVNTICGHQARYPNTSEQDSTRVRGRQRVGTAEDSQRLRNTQEQRLFTQLKTHKGKTKEEERKWKRERECERLARSYSLSLAVSARCTVARINSDRGKDAEQKKRKNKQTRWISL